MCLWVSGQEGGEIVIHAKLHQKNVNFVARDVNGTNSPIHVQDSGKMPRYGKLQHYCKKQVKRVP